MDQHRVVPDDQWLAAGTALLAEEKGFTRRRDVLSQHRRDLPWRAVTKMYLFEGRAGRRTLADLFDGRSRVVVCHFLFDPTWDAGCEHCSFWADTFDGAVVHLNQRDVSMVVVSRAPYAKIATYQRRTGWRFTWLSAAGTDFNKDVHVHLTPDEPATGTAVDHYRTQHPPCWTARD